MELRRLGAVLVAGSCVIACAKERDCPTDVVPSLVLTITDATSGAAICNATATVVSPSGHDQTVVEASDAGATTCTASVFLLQQLDDQTVLFTVKVTAPGYADQTLPATKVSYDSCGKPRAEAAIAVKLQKN